MNGAQDWTGSISQSSVSLPVLSSGVSNYSFSASVPAYSTTFIDIISQSTLDTYRCFLSLVMISVNESSTLHHWAVEETNNNYAPFVRWFRQQDSVNLHEYEVRYDTPQSLRVVIENHHPSLTLTFEGVVQYYTVRR